jgi:hypothetical protein
MSSAMNTSLSTVDSLLNILPNQRNQRQDEHNLDKTRTSPSFNNDSEPPSYFEAIGIHPANETTASNQNHNSSRLSSLQFQKGPKCLSNTPSVCQTSSYISSNKEFSIQESPGCILINNPQHQRHHIIRTPYIYSQSAMSSSYASTPRADRNYIADTSLGSIAKPSETYLVWSIFTTIYCVLIGVVALVLSIKVYHYNKEGNYAKAFSRSRIARNLNIAGLFVGFVYMGIILLICFGFK